MSDAFEVLASGRWRREQLRAVWREESSFQADSLARGLIDAEWDRASQRIGIHLFDGPMCRLESFTVCPQKLELVLSPTSYKIFLGTNLTHPELEYRANPVGLSAGLITADGLLLMGRRSPNVAYYPDRIHPFAGALEPGDKSDIFGGMLRELAEEVSLQAKDISEIICLGIAQDLSLRQPELIFRVTTTLRHQQIEENLDEIEHRGIYAEPIGHSQPFEEPLLTPIARATRLLLAGNLGH